MNRYRLNQILEILLFPVTDPGLAKADPLLSCYQAYRDFMEESGRNSSGGYERDRKDTRYKERRRKVIDYIVEHSHGRVKSKDDIQMLCEYFYPMADVEQAMKRMRDAQADRKLRRPDMENMSRYYLRSFVRISRSLITYRDGVASIKQWIEGNEGKTGADIFSSATVFNKIEIWNLLCRITVPDIYIAMAAIENNMGMMALYEQKANIALADRLLEKRISKGVAENHLHFNVGFDYAAIWLPYMDLDFVEETEPDRWDQAMYVRLEMAVFRYAAACYLMEGKGQRGFRSWIEAGLSKEVARVLRNLYVGCYEGRLNPELRAAVHGLRARTESRAAGRSYDYLLNEIYGEYVEYKISSEFILLYQSCEYIKKNEWDPFFARIFIQYLRLKNKYFSKAHEDHVMQGLTFFQESYNTMKRHASAALPERELMIEIFRSQSRVSHLKKLEIRIAPKVNGISLNLIHYGRSRRNIHRQLYDQIYQVLYAYRQYILESTIGVVATWKLLSGEQEGRGRTGRREDILEAVRESKVNIPTLGIVFHFLKSDHLEDRSGNYCWRRVLGEEEHYAAYRMLKRMYMENVARALEEIRETIPRLNEYIVGIDAASDENAMEPWMFSPAYKIIRSHSNTRPVMETERGGERFSRIQNMGFTYHVGEDFRHIVSGLRHVDEVLEEFGYKAGDRLGHALALGIDIEQWMQDNEVVPVPMLEHLENLLWMWGTNTCQGITLPIQLEVLENKIMEIAGRLYDFPETINVGMLYTAYRMKFDVDHRAVVRRVLEREKGVECFACYCRRQGCYGVWTAELLLTTHYCPVYEERYERPELIPVSLEEIAVYKSLQEYLVHKVEQKGVYIETNPTSNLTIGDFSHMYQHPIFQLNGMVQGGGNHAFVTINSDDPAVFNTNVENELAYIYYAAEAQGVAKSEIIEWVDRIRQYGMEASFVKQEKSTDRILTEVEEIMRRIMRIDL